MSSSTRTPPRRGAGRTAYHPELRRIARFLPRRLVSQRTLPLIRRVMGLAARSASGDVPTHQIGNASVRLFVPPGLDAPAPGIVWIHGGGFVIGSAAQDDDVCKRLSKRLGAVVASVDYRLAPEHPFPAPLDDCADALTWLAERDDVDATRLVVGGMSAGGNLAAGLALRTRDEGVHDLVAQLLVYPMLDDRTSVDPAYDDREVKVWDNRSNRFGWESYLGGPAGAAKAPAYASPARADDLAGLPPTWVGVGTLDLFHDEDATYVERLREAGIAVNHVVVEGAFHAFDTMAPKANVTAEFTDAQIAWLRELLTGDD